MDHLRDIFFYGLFMDERVLQDKGVRPRNSRKAVVHGYQLKIGQRAMLVPQPASKVFGMVHALTEREINSLYAEPGLEMYQPETVVATFEDGSTSALTTFNLPETPADEEPNIEYTAKLRSVLERLGFPVQLLSILLLLGVGCSAYMSSFQSSFFFKFSLRELVERNQSKGGLNCSQSGGGGGMSMGGGGIGKEQSNFHKLESFSCQVTEGTLFDEAKFIQALKVSVENDLAANKATIVSSKNADATKFYVEYALGNTTGRVEISSTTGPANFYTLKADLDEKTRDAK